MPAALLAMRPEGLVALHSIAHRSSNLGLMGPRASTRTYRCRTMVGLPDIEGVAAELKPRQMSAVFAGRRVAEWAGQLALTENSTLDAGRVKEVFATPLPRWPVSVAAWKWRAARTGGCRARAWTRSSRSGGS